MEVIICTPNYTSGSSSLDDNICQETFTTKSLNGLQRGREQGDAPKTKTNLKNSRFVSGQKQKTIYQLNSISDLVSVINKKFALSHPIWVGAFMTLSLVICSFAGATTVHAADLTFQNVDLAKKVIQSVTPAITPEIAKDQSVKVSVDTTEDFIQKPLVVETQITVEPIRVLASKSVRTPVDYSLVKGPHYFPYGYCTYYVSQKRTVTWSGNAGTWLSGAKSTGTETGKTPKAGAIMVTSEGGKTGHVAYVEKVDGDQVTISEMNFKGYGITSSRTIAASSKFIKGYIY
jgi:surface antigen